MSCECKIFLLCGVEILCANDFYIIPSGQHLYMTIIIQVLYFLMVLYFSLGLVILKQSDHMKIRNQDIDNLDNSWMLELNASTMVVAPWPFCRGRQPTSHMNHLRRLMSDIRSKKQHCKVSSLY